MSDKIEALERLAKLRAEGILTDEEFAAQKAHILRQSDTLPGQPSRSISRNRGGGVARSNYVPALIAGVAVIVIIAGGLFYLVRQTAGESKASAVAAAKGPPSAPICTDTSLQATVKQLVEAGTIAKAVNSPMLGIANIVERSYDPVKQRRICAAEVTLNDGQHHLAYSITYTGNPGDYAVQTLADPALAVAPEPAAPAPAAGVMMDNYDSSKRIRAIVGVNTAWGEHMPTQVECEATPYGPIWKKNAKLAEARDQTWNPCLEDRD